MKDLFLTLIAWAAEHGELISANNYGDLIIAKSKNGNKTYTFSVDVKEDVE